MSEMSALSHQYEKLMESFEVLLEAVVLFKKQQLLLFGKGQNILKPIPEDKVQDAKSKLTSFLQEIHQILVGEDYEDTFIPFAISSDYKKRLAKAPTMKANIKEILNILSNDGELSDKHFVTLEKLISALDFERSVVFRKLRTRKG